MKQPNQTEADFLDNATDVLLPHLTEKGLREKLAGHNTASIFAHIRDVESLQNARLHCHQWENSNWDHAQIFVKSEMTKYGLPVDKTDLDGPGWQRLSHSCGDRLSKHPEDKAGKALAAALLIMRARDKVMSERGEGQSEWEQYE